MILLLLLLLPAYIQHKYASHLLLRHRHPIHYFFHFYHSFSLICKCLLPANSFPLILVRIGIKHLTGATLTCANRRDHWNPNRRNRRRNDLANRRRTNWRHLKWTLANRAHFATNAATNTIGVGMRNQRHHRYHAGNKSNTHQR